MAKDAQEIKVVKTGDDLKVSVKADLETALAMVAATVMAISEGSEIDTKDIYNVLSGATEEVKKGESEDCSTMVLTELVGPIIMWMKNNLPPFATIIIDSKGVTVKKGRRQNGEQRKWWLN